MSEDQVKMPWEERTLYSLDAAKNKAITTERIDKLKIFSELRK